LIKYIEDSTPKHLGGSGRPKYEINDYNLDGRLIILFDDIYTTGKCMATLCSKLTKHGARVIGGITIGITKTDKEERKGFVLFPLLNYLKQAVYDLMDS
jgi:orotate phosphoribosyltransferase